MTLKEMKEISNGCNVGVVATKMVQEKEIQKEKPGLFGSKSEKKFVVEPKRKHRFCLFSSHNDNDSEVKVSEILAATANAPVYFEKPVPVNKIGKSKNTEYFVDGGIGANCPISVALKNKSSYGTIISIAPPKYTDQKFHGYYFINYFIIILY